MSAPAPEGYYPQEPYYAPGWSAPGSEQTPPPRRGGRRLLVAAAALVALGLVAAAVVGGRFVLDTRLLGEVDRPVDVHARQLDVGHCLAALPQDGPVGRVRVVPCASPHVAEVLGVRTLTEDAWPGQDAVDRTVQAACEMDAAQAEAGFQAVVWAPSERSWQQRDRRGLCLAWHADGPVRGSWTAGDAVG